MDVLELIDETFDKDRTEVYELSIQVSLNGFSYAVKDTIRNTFIALVTKPFTDSFINHQNWSETVNSMISLNPILSCKFKKIYFEYSFSYFTIVPAELFDVSKQKDIFELSHPLPEYFELQNSTHINGNNFIQIFSIPYTLSSAWLQVQPNTKFISPLSPLLYYSEVHKLDRLVHVDISDMTFLLAYHVDGVLVASNCFVFKHENDIVYYTINFCKCLNIDFFALNLHVSGVGAEYNDLHKILSNYFPKISMEAHYNSIHFSYQLLRYRVKFFRLFNSTAICE